jgi:hypothetical protein
MTRPPSVLASLIQTVPLLFAVAGSGDGCWPRNVPLVVWLYRTFRL